MSAKTTTAPLDSGSAGHPIDDRAYVFVRYWPFFSDKFPYDQFTSFDSRDFDRKIRSAIAAEQWRRFREICDVLHEQDRKRAEAIVKQRKSAIFGPNPHIRRPDQSPRASSDPPEELRFCKALSRIGWREGETYLKNTETGRVLHSPIIWLATVYSEEVATNLMHYLESSRPQSIEAAREIRSFNPKFGYVSSADLTGAQRSTARAELALVWCDEPADGWTKITRQFRPSIDRFCGANGLSTMASSRRDQQSDNRTDLATSDAVHGLSVSPGQLAAAAANARNQVEQLFGHKAVADNNNGSPYKRMSGSPKKSWIQSEADAEISKFKADRAPHFNELVNKIDRSSGKARKAAIKAARAVFGRNKIHEATGIPKGMVSNSSEWGIIKNALGFEESLGVKSHFGKAEEDAGEAAGDTTMADVVQRETVTLIQARVCKQFTKEQAAALVGEYLSGRHTDDAVRQILETLESDS